MLPYYQTLFPIKYREVVAATNCICVSAARHREGFPAKEAKCLCQEAYVSKLSVPAGRYCREELLSAIGASTDALDEATAVPFNVTFTCKFCVPFATDDVRFDTYQFENIRGIDTMILTHEDLEKLRDVSGFRVMDATPYSAHIREDAEIFSSENVDGLLDDVFPARHTSRTSALNAERWRQYINSYFHLGMSATAIADNYGKTSKTVELIIEHARKRMAELI